MHEKRRSEELLAAQNKAAALFAAIEERDLIRAGICESELNEAIYQLAREMYGITTYWHKRIVRAGKNTLCPYAENPPDLMLRDDEILFVDLGPVFEEWEADFGRTFVLGNNPLKLKLRDDVGKAFAEGKRYFEKHPELSSQEYFEVIAQLATRFGWEWGGPIAGHLIGHFPHERIEGDKVTLYIHPGSSLKMRSLDEQGRKRHWILEIHFVDRKREIGGFYEELLTV